MLQLQLLGTTRILLDDKAIGQDLPAKSQALLIYLAMTRQAHSRLFLAGLFWPDKDDPGARMNLRQALRQLRLSLPEYLQATRDSIGLNPELGVEVDALQFEAQVRPGLDGDIAQLQAAVERYGGEFLAGFFIDDASEFESWMLLEQERFRSLALQALQGLSNYYVEKGDTNRGLQVTHRLLAMEPLHEQSYRHMMILLAWEGQIRAALAQYETCHQILMAELGIEPSPETTALYEQIRTGTLRLPSAHPASAGRPARRHKPAHNLPRTFTRFIGRQAEIDRLSTWLQDPDCALITLRGPGGVGKTRLAVQVARQNLSRYADGAWFVDLSTISRAENFFPALADGLGIELSSQTNIKSRVLGYLRDRHLLLVLDNFEHLMGATSELMEVLQGAPNVQIIVTSRESLNLSAEWLFEADGLALNERDGQTSPAVRLFVERVQQWRSATVPDPADYATIVRICRLLDGMPLAIELAAALTRSLSIADIATAIEQDLDILATRRGDVPDRHRSLRAVFEYSWQLLSQREKKVLSRLSVFRGGFTIPAAEVVTDEPNKVLAALQRKSFLYQPVAGRYQMHELLQGYAGEKAVELGTAEAARRRHRAFYLDFLNQRETAIRGAGARLALMEIRHDLPNVSRAWEWAAREGDTKALESGRAALASFCSLSGLFEEGDLLFGQAVDGVRLVEEKAVGMDEEARQVLARLLAERASFLDSLARYDQAIELAREAVDRAASCRAKFGPAAGLARAYHVWGVTLIHQGNYNQAEAILDQGLEIARAAGLGRLEGMILSNKGVARFYLADYPIARAFLERARALFQAAGDLSGEGSTINNLAIIHVRTGDYVHAVPLYEQSLNICREIGNRGGEILATANLGIAASLQGAYTAAEDRLLDALAGSREIGERRVESALLNSLGANRLQQADYDLAQERLTQALDLARQIGNQNTESEVLTNLGLLAQWREESAQAWDYSRQGLQLAESIGEQTMAGFAWMGMGRAQEAMGLLSEATEAYEKALKIRETSSWYSLIAETRAGLARVRWEQGLTEEALAIVEDILPCLKRSDVRSENCLDGAQEPVRVYLTCHRILEAAGDRRAEQITELVARFVSKRSGAITDPDLRRSYLLRVPGHAELQEAIGRLPV